MSSQLIFPLTDVKELGELAVDAVVPSDEFAEVLAEGKLVGDVTVAGTIHHVDDEARFEGTASGRWRFECTRCLAPIENPWREKIEAEAPIDGGPMDLTEEVRQSIGLAEPMKIFCKPDCKGLCVVCRQNRNEKECGHPQPQATEAGLPQTTRPRLTPRPDKG